MFIPSVLVYLQRNADVLVMRRNKEPNLGLWVAPGGKVELSESPHDAARREIFEEAGYSVGSLTFRGFCTEISPRDDWQWFLFIFATHDFVGTLRGDQREGALAWKPIDVYLREMPIPQADAVFAPRVLAPESDFFHAKFIYDEKLILTEWIEY